MMRVLIQTLVYILFIIVSVHAEEFTREKKIINAFESGDDFALASEVIDFTDRFQSSSESFLLLHDIYACADIVGYELVRKKLKTLTEINPRSAVEEMIRRKAVGYLSDLEYKMRINNGTSFIEKYHPVSKWNISALYKKYGRGDIVFGFSEDTRPRPDKALKNIAIDKDGYANPGKLISGEAGVVYAHAVIDLSENTNIRIESEGEYVFFVNGVKAGENIRGAKYRSVRLFHSNEGGPSVISIKTFVNDSSFRVSIEDAMGKPLVPVELPKESVFGRSSITEINDYVLSDLYSRPESAEKDLYLGWYFSECGSDEVFKYYDRAARHGNSMISFLLAHEYIDRGMKEGRDARIVEGFSRLDELLAKKPGMVPLYSLQLQKMMMTVETEKVLAYIHDVRKRTRVDYGFALRESTFILEYLPDMACRVIEDNIRKYPDSVPLKLLQAQLLLRNNNAAGVTALKHIALSYRFMRTEELIAGNAIKSGESSELIDYTDISGDDNLTTLRAEAMISCGKYEQAKKVLSKAISRKNHPEWLTLLGRIEVLCGRDPDLYWEKCSALYPEKKFPRDYIRYVNGEDNSELKSLVNSKDIEEEIHRYKNGKVFESSIVNRVYITKISYNKTGRFYCEEVIYLRNDKDVEKYGEYRIPFSRGVSIVHAETYDRKGKVVSSSRITEVNSSLYLSIEGAEKDNLLHIAYEADSYNVNLYGSALIDTGTIYINDYNEPVLSAEVILTVDRAVNVEIRHSNDLQGIKDIDNGFITTRLKAKAILGVESEDNSPDSRSLLSWYSISSVQNHYDLASWYRGVFLGKFSQTISPVKTKRSRVEIIKDVCKEISTLMRSGDDSPQYIRFAEDVLHSGIATAHEKMITAVELIRRKGIESYPCLAAERFYPSVDNEASIEKFSAYLLYVPGDDKEPAIWIDCSDPNLPVGCVRSELENATAIVISDSGAFIRKVYSRIPSSETIEMNITVKSTASEYSIKSVFRGDSARIRSFFDDKDKWEKHGAMYSDLFSSDSDLAQINISGKDRDEFEIKISGEMRDAAVEGMKSLFLTPFRKSGKIQNYASGQTRQTALVIKEGLIINEKYTYVLPDSVLDAEIHNSESINYEGITIAYSVEKKAGDKILTARRKTVLSPVSIDVSRYGEFTDFLKKCSVLDTMKIRLDKKLTK